MTPKWNTFNPEDLAKRYASGESISKIARNLGVTHKVIRLALERHGISIRSLAKAQQLRTGLTDSDRGQIVTRYREGASSKSLADRFGVSRQVINRLVRHSGLKIRGGSEANLLRMKRMTREERLALTARAHAAVRGSRHSEEHRSKIAASREGSFRSPLEKELFEQLRSRGLTCTPNKAIGRYNVDVGVNEGSIAVEVFGGNWHSAPGHAGKFRKRCDYILDRGWLPVIVWITSFWPLESGAIEYIVSLSKRRCLGETLGRQEHVIRGTGYDPTLKHDLDTGALISTHEARSRPWRQNHRLSD